MDFLSALRDVAGPESVYTDEMMSGHTTLRVGGPAKYFVQPRNEKDIAQYIRLAKENGIEYTVVGNGSNLLVSDEGFDGLVILIGKNMSVITLNGDVITAMAGATLYSVASLAKKNALTGFEFAAGIPGSIGGACFMNAGAYGGEMKDVLVSVKTIDTEGHINIYNNSEMELSYRNSIFAKKSEIIISADIKLQKGNEAEIIARMEELAAKRREKQPLEFPSAGSTFKRPEGYFAGKLIEDAGLKGKGVGGACVSEKHAGFVINFKSATAKDVYNTICMVIDRVKETSGVVLEPEVRMLGRF